MKIILIGAPGSGKGTVGKKLSKVLQIPTISVGDIFRDNMKRQTELGKLIYETMQQGKLVSDKIVLKVVQERINCEDCQNGFILDGFPRTVEQAKAFSKICKVDFIFNLNVSKRELIKRLSGRGRDDDTPEVIKERIKIHEMQFGTIKNYYGKKLINVNGNHTKKEVFDEIFSKVDKYQKEAEK